MSISITNIDTYSIGFPDSLGLYVVVTLDIGRLSNGVDYKDESYCNMQRKWVSDIVEEYQHHEALLYWIIGNEIHLMNHNFIPDVWKEVNELSKLVHKIDPNHLTTTSMGPFNRRQMIQVKMFTSDIDFLSINAHQTDYLVSREMRNILWGWEGPYVISEWAGPLYWHNHLMTNWGAVIEPNSTQKAKYYNHSFYVALQTDSSKCMGGFVFYWGEKQERTHTWFSLIPENKYVTQPVEVLYANWSENSIRNYSPRIDKISFENFNESINLYIKSGAVEILNIDVTDPENDSLTLRVDLYEEADYVGIYGGDSEYRPTLIYSDSLTALPKNYNLTIPEKEGAYRVFLNVYDQNNNVAIQNIPFYVVPV